MENIIINLLDSAMQIAINQTPQTKEQYIEVDISEVKPLELLEFMRKNNIPETATFEASHSGEEGHRYNASPVLSYRIEVPTTQKDKDEHVRKRFREVAWRVVYDSLTKNRYKRVGYDTGLLKEFDDTTLYDMYINKQVDRIVKYYSLPFRKIEL